jgi:ElaB/YqjD/DUF883 family membrane-anchored ribosome-binding protein
LKQEENEKMEHSDTPSEAQPTAGAGSSQFKDNGHGAGGPNPSIADSMSRGKEAIGAAASEAIQAAGSDLQALRADLNSLRDTVAKFLSQASSEAAKSARDVTSSLAGQVGGAAGGLAGKGAEMASAASGQAKTFASELENMARRNPIGAMAGAVLLGVLLGLMGRRS